MSKWLVSVLLIWLASGCATEDHSLQTGNLNLTDVNIERIKAGISDDEVFAMMGIPDETVDLADGAVEWIYRGSEGEWKRPSSFSKKTSQIRAKFLSVKIDAKGFVTNVSYDEWKETERKSF